MKFGTKIIGGWFKRNLSPKRKIEAYADAAVDSLKDDQLVIVGRSWFDWPSLSVMHEFRVGVEDKGESL